MNLGMPSLLEFLVIALAASMLVLVGMWVNLIVRLRRLRFNPTEHTPLAEGEADDLLKAGKHYEAELRAMGFAQLTDYTARNPLVRSSARIAGRAMLSPDSDAVAMVMVSRKDGRWRVSLSFRSELREGLVIVCGNAYAIGVYAPLPNRTGICLQGASPDRLWAAHQSLLGRKSKGATVRLFQTADEFLEALNSDWRRREELQLHRGLMKKTPDGRMRLTLKGATRAATNQFAWRTLRKHLMK